MNENIFTEELSKERVTLFNKVVIDTVRKYYPKEIYGMDLLMLACRAVNIGEAIFDEEFISNYAEELKSGGNTNKLAEIIKLEIAAAESKYFIENAQDINSLPEVHKNNKKVLSSFIREGLCNGFKVKCKIVARLMEEVESSQADHFIKRSVSI